MHPARALTLLVPAVLLAPVTGVVGPASAAEGTVLTINDRPDPAIYHDEIGPPTADVVRHSGKLTTVDGQPVAGAVVTLLRQLPGGEWQSIDEDATTNAKGRYVFRTFAAGNADYQARYDDGDALTVDPVSAVEPLEVMRDFNAALLERRSVAILKGDINPGWNDKVVRWQHKKCKRCQWRVIDKARSGARGGWRFEARYPPVGKSWFYRATIRGTGEFAESVSATLITTTTPADRTAPARAVQLRH